MTRQGRRRSIKFLPSIFCHNHSQTNLVPEAKCHSYRVETFVVLSPVAVMELHRRFGLNVKRVRREAALSQEALADLADVARSYMSDVERGARNPTLKVVERIAAALDVRPGSLLD